MRGQRHAPAATYPGKDPVTIVQEAGWTSGPVWTGTENLTPTGIRSPNRPARRQSLYRLRYPAHYIPHDLIFYIFRVYITYVILNTNLYNVLLRDVSALVLGYPQVARGYYISCTHRKNYELPEDGQELMTKHVGKINNK